VMMSSLVLSSSFLGLLHLLLVFTTENAAFSKAISQRSFLPSLFYSVPSLPWSKHRNRKSIAGLFRVHSSPWTEESELPTNSIGDVLSTQFQEVFAHFLYGDNASSSEFLLTEYRIRTNLLRTRHSLLPLRNCCLSKSTIPNAGFGVFCTRDIKAGETITLYPGDAILQWQDLHHLDDRTTGLQILFGTHVPEGERLAALNTNATVEHEYIFMRNIPDARNYEVRITDTVSLIGDPGRCRDPAYMGHMINDFCSISYIGDDENVEDSYSDAELERQYNVKSIAASNCKIYVGTPDGCHVEIVATRDIALGEECFLSYGVDYWRTRQRPPLAHTALTRESPATGFAVKKKVPPKKKPNQKGGSQSATRRAVQ
jgi:SET domain